MRSLVASCSMLWIVVWAGSFWQPLRDPPTIARGLALSLAPLAVVLVRFLRNRPVAAARARPRFLLALPLLWIAGTPFVLPWVSVGVLGLGLLAAWPTSATGEGLPPSRSPAVLAAALALACVLLMLPVFGVAEVDSAVRSWSWSLTPPGLGSSLRRLGPMILLGALLVAAGLGPRPEVER